MIRMSELDIFLKNFAKQLSNDETHSITADMEIKSLESWDSLAKIMVENMIMTHYNVILDDEDVALINTIAELFLFVKKKQNHE